MIEYFGKHKFEHKIRDSGQITLKTCPLCTSPHGGVTSNLWTLNFKPNNGAF